MLDEHAFTVMLLDLRLPDLHGTRVLPLARAKLPGLHVIIITAHGNAADEKECRDLGAMAFLNKPIDFSHLIEILADLESKGS